MREPETDLRCHSVAGWDRELGAGSLDHKEEQELARVGWEMESWSQVLEVQSWPNHEAS